MSNKPSLKDQRAGSFKKPDLDSAAAKLSDQSAQQNYNGFIINHRSKNFDDFQEFIKLISPSDYDHLPDKKRREEQSLNKGTMTEVHPALIQAFYMKQNAMNQLESQALNKNIRHEITENSFQALEKMGKCLSRLYVDKIMQDSNGRYLLYMIDCSNDISEIEAKYKNHSFEVDDQVAFCNVEYSPEICTVGNVYQKLHHGIVISIEEYQINEEIYSRFRAGEPFSLVKQNYHAAFEVNNQTLEKLLEMSSQPQGSYHNPYMLPPQQGPVCAPIIEDLLRENLDDKENEAISGNNNNIEFFDSVLNEDQQKAVKAALSVKNLYLIDGPAGTGKTRVLAELIHQYVKKGLKVLACGPSVHAVDSLIGRMLNKEIKACRIGKSGNQDEDIDRLSMDTLLKKNKRIMMIQEECDTLLESFKATEQKHFLKKMEATEETASKHLLGVSKVIIDYADVVFSTLSGAGASILEESNFSFDVVIIDECPQATEIYAWAAILKTKKLVIAGDRFQLPPFIIYERAQELGRNFTLFDRLRKRLPRNLRQVLRVQYRMNEKIMAWSNKHFYTGKMVTNDICAQQTLQEYLKESSEIKADQVPVLMLVDTKNFGYAEKRGVSYSNIGEAAVVLELLEYLLANYNLRKEEIGVISPYQDQNELITKAIDCKSDLKGIKCQTVDYFQGKEKEVIIISMVRSNESKIIGLLDDAKRMNVAVTRAKRFVAIVCDTSTICKAELPFIIKLINHFKNQGQVMTPDDFKGIGYQTRFLQFVLNGEIVPPENKKSQVKEMKNMDAINQVLNSKDLEEEGKIEMEEIEEMEEKVRKSFTRQRMVDFMPRNLVVNQNMDISPMANLMMNSSLIYSPEAPVNRFMMPFPLYPNLSERGHSYPQNNRYENKSGIGMNYYHPRHELGIQNESEDNRLVGNSAIFVKTESKKKKKNKQAAGGGIQIKSEDFPELE